MAASKRIASIDVFRALTMLCMIFVNDLWTLSGVPHWLEHAGANEDFLGFSDIVFPCFLFVLGMSIPFAIESRIAKGQSGLLIAKHIILRSFALIIMGVFSVNMESGLSETVGIGRPVFIILMVTGFFLVWNVYPKAAGWEKYLFSACRIAGIALLIVLALVFRDTGGGYMQTHWWGILGLIGWTYFLCALIYLIIRNRFFAQSGVLLFFILLCMAGSNHWLGFFDGIVVGNGALHALSMAGLIISLLFLKYSGRFSVNRILGILILSGCVMIVAGFLVHPFWIISKIKATPTWVFLCIGIAAILYVFIYWLVEIGGLENIFRVIQPAGTATLTCYLLPYIIYNVFELASVHFPEAILMYPLGLAKSLAFALLVTGLTALLGKLHIKLKI
ncbi:MAG: DUF5009 domain-containing protein [Bacteroidales bacterium]|jgi:predicted acyltransferase|nr:DUF5009 domain-containing protein [Bacteroidales bacterium]